MKRAIVVGMIFAARLALADAVPPPPSDCGPGEHGRTSHQGQWCEPAPPKEGCPAGSYWMSTSARDAWCNGTAFQCADKESAKDPHCKKTSLCVEEIERVCGFRTSCEGQKYIEERATRACEEGDKKKVCGGKTRCVTKLRYVYEAPEKKGSLDPVKLGVRIAIIPLLGLGLLFAARVRRARSRARSRT
jgi:hypothetical protein